MKILILADGVDYAAKLGDNCSWLNGLWQVIAGIVLAGVLVKVGTRMMKWACREEPAGEDSGNS